MILYVYTVYREARWCRQFQNLGTGMRSSCGRGVGRRRMFRSMGPRPADGTMQHCTPMCLVATSVLKAMYFDPEALHVQLGRLIESMPDLYAPVTVDTSMWLGRAIALVEASGAMSDAVALRTASHYLDSVLRDNPCSDDSHHPSHRAGGTESVPGSSTLGRAIRTKQAARSSAHCTIYPARTLDHRGRCASVGT